MFRYCSLALLFLVGSSINVQSAPNIQVQVGSTPIAISLGGTAGGVSIVDFGSAEIGKSVSKTFTVKNTGSETVSLLEPIKVPAGFTLMRRFGSTALAPGRTTTFVAALNSARAGRLRGNISFTLRGTQDQPVTIPVAGSVFGSPSLRIIQSGEVGFRTIGKWVPATVQTNGGAAHSIRAGTGTSVASWTFSGLQPGQYRVAVTWPVQANHATNAPFTVVDGTKAFTTVSVNQQSPPADFHDAGVSWKTLGIFRITGNSLVVRLTDRANGTVLADAIRIEKVGFPSQIIQPGDKGFHQAGAAKNAQAIWTFSG
ncbi:MAG TPA: choice-of-anchor D domain-containing protein, partial [Gemmataceae bacterium]|nr:choice-of-anchor D domain-containing protein [Gemmataceae bacterium]